VIGFLITLLYCAPAVSQSKDPESPQELFGDLFVAVQNGALFPDSKEFPDAQPNFPPTEILAQYRSAHPATPTALKEFVTAHFALPEPVITAPSPPHQVPIVAHIDALWDELTRSTTFAPAYSSALTLPKPYVVPGGRFREMYYWDSYFTMLGLLESSRPEMVKNMVDDFAYLIDAYGHVPNGARTYYVSRSQPPFFFEMVQLLPGEDALAQYLSQLKREYAFWMQGSKGLQAGKARRRVVAMPDGSLLNRYWDDDKTPRDESYREDTVLAGASDRPASQLYRDIRAAAESGWDFSSRWLADAHTLASIITTEIVPVDLNSLLYGLENAIRQGCAQRADRACAAEFSRRAARRRSAINRYLWDGRAGAYFDYRWTKRLQMPQPSAASLYPLFVGLSSPIQAAAVADMTSHRLLKIGGIVTTTVNTQQQWDAPNGWAPLQWIAVSGLRSYGKNALAETIACRFMLSVGNVYRQSGKLVEKYDVISTGREGGGGEYPSQDGFGWTNGVIRKLIALYPKDASLLNSEECPQGGREKAMRTQLKGMPSS
jgi:alpha,alpha-trehalase